MARVGVEFYGVSTGAVRAARSTRQEIAGVGAQARRTEQDLGKLSRGALAGSGIFRGLGRSVAFASAGFLGGYGLTAAIGGAVKELQDSIRVSAQTSQALRSTGNVAGTSAREIDQLAQSLMRKTGVDDEAIKTSENLLLTFTQVRNEAGKGNDVFNQATRAVVDMSAVIGDLSSNSIQLGKALNDPLTGMTALRRVGVSFTAQQREQIKVAVEHGQILKAQKIILREVQTEFGGQAAAQNKATGGLNTLRESIKNTSAEFLRALIPSFKEGVVWLQKQVDWLQNTDEGQAKLKETANALKDAVLAVVAVIKLAIAAIKVVDGVTGGFKTTMELLIGLKVASVLSGWASGFKTLAGAEGIAAATGSIAGKTGLLANLTKLKMLGPITIGVVVAYAVVKKSSGFLESLPGAKFVDKHLGGDWLNRQLGLGGGGGKGGTGGQINPVNAGNPVLGSAGTLVGTPGQGTHSRSEGAGPGGYLWQDDDAVDIVATPASIIVAVEAGRIASNLRYGGDSGRFSGWGFTLLADSGNEYYYKHLKTVSIKAGQRVRRGQVLGQGTTTGHIHFARRGAQTAAQVLGAPQPGAAAPGRGPVSKTTFTPHTGGGDTGTAVPISAGTSLQVSGRLDDEQKQNAQLIYDLATARGLTPQQALQLVAVAYAESGLRTSAINKNSGAFGLFQLLSPGYVKKYNQLRAQGFDPATANFLAIFPDYKAYFKAHPKAAPGAAGAAVERSGQGAAYYAKGIGTTFSLTGGGGGTQGPRGTQQPTLVSVRAAIDAQLRLISNLAPDVSAQLSPLAKVAEQHLTELRAHLKKGMSPTDLAETRAGIARWGKVVRDEISKATEAAKTVAQEAADAAALAFNRQFRDASTGVFRIFQSETDQHVKAFQRDTERALTGMRKAFEKQMQAFDEQTRIGLQSFVVPTTPAEQALASFQAARQAEADAKAMADAQASGDPEQIRQLQLDLQQRALEEAARQSRDAQDRSTEDQQRTYQQQRDDQRNAMQEAENDREQAYQEQRDATLAVYQQLREDQQTHLQDDLDDWATWIQNKKKTWAEFLAWLSTRGFAVPSGWFQGIDDEVIQRNLFGASAGDVGGVRTKGPGGHAPGFALGGRVPGMFVGREDTVLARVSPGETVIDRHLTRALEHMTEGGGVGGPVFSFDGATFIGAPTRDAARAWAAHMQDELDRLIGYRNPIT